METNLTMNGDEIYVIIDPETNAFKELMVPGCHEIYRNPYKFITDDGNGHVILKFARKEKE
jgi:hypothetical protein